MVTVETEHTSADVVLVRTPATNGNGPSRPAVGGVRERRGGGGGVKIKEKSVPARVRSSSWCRKEKLEKNKRCVRTGSGEDDCDPVVLRRKWRVAMYIVTDTSERAVIVQCPGISSADGCRLNTDPAGCSGAPLPSGWSGPEREGSGSGGGAPSPLGSTDPGFGSRVGLERRGEEGGLLICLLAGCGAGPEVQPPHHRPAFVAKYQKDLFVFVMQPESQHTLQSMFSY